MGAAGELQGPAVGVFTPEQLDFWASHHPDVWVWNTISGGYKLQFRRRPPAFGQVRVTRIRDPGKARALRLEILALLEKGAIVPVDPLLDPGGFYSRYFLVPKKTGDLRPVLDLRGLNTFLKILPFRMLRTTDVLHTVSDGEWFTSIDLKDAYFHVPMAPHHCRFLRFAFQGRHFQFRVLPFGLSLSPRVFTRFVAAALAPLQARGLKILPHLDDWLICAPSRHQAVRDTNTVLEHVRRLGLRVNLAKSKLVPCQRTVFLGVALDTTSMLARPSPQRVDDIVGSLAAFRRGAKLPFIRCLSLLGKLVSISAVVPLGLLFLRPFQMWINGLHLDPARYAHKYVRVLVSGECLASLARWRDRSWLERGVRVGTLPARREVVFTDASSTGWGATWQGQVVQGVWSPRHRGLHINVLELMAVHLALRHFMPRLRDRHVFIRTDNTSVVYHINHMGGTRSRRLTRVTRQLLTWAWPLLSGLRAAHVPGSRNLVADFLSRQALRPGEWRLHPSVVSLIWESFGRARVDLFASAETTHCPLWFSLGDSSSPLGLDALAHDWPRVLLYAFPPLSLIPSTLLRVLQEGHRLLLVAPFWPGRVWFPLLHRLCCGPPMCLPNRRDLLSQMGGRVFHPDPGRLQLWVWPLQGPV